MSNSPSWVFSLRTSNRWQPQRQLKEALGLAVSAHRSEAHECFEEVLSVGRRSEKTHHCERLSGFPHTRVSVPWHGVWLLLSQECALWLVTRIVGPLVLPESESPCVPSGAWLCMFPRAEVMLVLLFGGAHGGKQGGGLESRHQKGHLRGARPPGHVLGQLTGLPLTFHSIPVHCSTILCTFNVDNA